MVNSDIVFCGRFPFGRTGSRSGKIYGNAVDGARRTIANLLKAGYEIEILTSRSPEEWAMVVDWLTEKDFPSDLRVTNIKKPALAYIDDRAIRFISWADVAHYFL